MAKAPRFDLDPAGPLDEAAKRILCTLFTAAFDEAPAVLEGEDVRATHDMRVALRRLSTGLTTFRNCFGPSDPKPDTRRLRRVRKRLGVVRDADVHLAVLRSALGGATAAEHCGLAFALETLAARRREALARFAVELSQFDRAGFLKAIATARPQRERTVGEALRPALRRALNGILDGGDAAIKRGDGEQLHAMRIAVKRLRYVTEFFRSVLGPEGDKTIELLGRLQEHLGTIADADAFDAVYRELRAAIAPGDARVAGLESRVSATRRERKRALSGLRTLWKSTEAPYRERLAASISAALGSLSPKPE